MIKNIKNRDANLSEFVPDRIPVTVDLFIHSTILVHMFYFVKSEPVEKGEIVKSTEFNIWKMPTLLSWRFV